MQACSTALFCHATTNKHSDQQYGTCKTRILNVRKDAENGEVRGAKDNLRNVYGTPGTDGNARK